MAQPAAVAEEEVPEGYEGARPPGPSPARDLLRRWRHHPMALAGAIGLLLFAGMAVLAPVVAPYGPDAFSLGERLSPPWPVPGWAPGHWLGTDELGRDIVSRLFYGARLSLAVGAAAVVISGVVGTALGTAAGYFGGRLDQVVSRFADLLMAFPYLLFAILVMGILGPGLVNLVLALSFKAWVEFFRIARGETMAHKGRDYVEAARAIGRSSAGILWKEILPNVAPTLLVVATSRMGYMVLMEASLSFLGLGAPSDVPAWGSMVAAGRDHLVDAWWVSTIPGLAILLLVMSINGCGEGLRDILDPHLRGR
ncbi:ABC transporter permease [Carboxydochorda subterranea]|uniref:ABC transporter permease n=1 Tax=Carboxydichorda subterranea TaxID=3109565 RepID=A0ABZ1BZR5_9FIRM|nr:ABC transporter permease [Limnochorda sp. L945t]WRP18065.1 ABC transporter permease [Limnochorda sp. L945t]